MFCGRSGDRGFYLGHLWHGNRARDHVFYPPGDETNILLIGPPGSGKSTLLINNAILLKRPKVWFDVKGEISAVVIPALEKENPGSTRVINPWGVLVDRCPYLKDSGYNPVSDLPEPTDKNFSDDCDNLSIGINASHGTGGQNAFFTDGATDAISALMGHLRIIDGKDANLGTLRDKITEPYGVDKKGDPIGSFRTFIELSGSHCPEVREKAGRFASGTKSAMETLFTAARETTCLSSPSLKQSLRGPGYDWQKSKNAISALAIIIPIDKLNSHRGYLRMLVITMLRELLRSPPSASVPAIALMLDEFPQLGFLRELLTASATARGMGVRLFPIVVQSLGQLRAIYGENDSATIISNSGCLLSYAPRDFDSAEYLSKMCGDKIVNVTSHNVGTDANGNVNAGQSTSPQYEKLFRPEELMAMPPGRMLCLVRGSPPFFTQVPGYWESKFGRGLAPNPYYSR